MSGNYSCFDSPADLSLTGSQVSPTRKSKPNSARSSASSRGSSASKYNRTDGWTKSTLNKPVTKSSYTSKDNRTRTDSFAKSRTTKPNSKLSHSSKKGHSSRDKPSSSLAMTFPSKESKQTIPLTSTSDEYLDSFFDQSLSKRKTKSQTSSHSSTKSKSKFYEERVFSIPDTARSESNSSDEGLSAATPQLKSVRKHQDNRLIDETDFNAAGDANVDYLKSYLSNMDKYKDTSPLNDDFADFTPRNSLIASPKSPSSTLTLPEDSDPLLDEKVVGFRKNRSARKIQTWYRRHHARRKRDEAIMKRMFAQKKQELESSLVRDSLRMSLRTEEEKKKHRQQREREARKQAIKELEEKRKAEKEKIRKVAEEEIEAVKRRVEMEKRKLSRSRTSSKSSGMTTKVKSTDEDVPYAGAPASIPDDNIETSSVKERFSEAESETECFKEPVATLKSRTTLDDVLETIKLLEEEPEHLVKPKSAINDKLSWIDELQADLHSNVSKSSRASRAASTQQDPASILTEAKLQSINNYLDEVEKKSTPPVSHIEEVDAAKYLQDAEQAATEVTSQMLKLKLNLEEKQRSVKLLQDALTQQRELNHRQIKEQETEFNHRLKMQKDQYESAIKRHLSFIDQLIDDKKSLNDKCEKLVVDMKQAEGKYQKKIKNLTDVHQSEMKKSKDVLAAAEKIRREKWIGEKTKKIKEMTVKGLEPEIQRLIAKHKEEMKKAKSIQEAELLRSDERAGQRYIRQTEELREQLEREKEAACAREREMARQRYEKQMEQEEIALQQQRKRLFNEVAEEKERINYQAARQRNEIEELKQQIEANSRIASSTLREEFENSTVDLQRRHKEEIQGLQERVDIEKQAWQENYMKKQESFMMQKERELKDSVRRDRDSEIESAILRLEDDMHQQREELERTTENRIKRIRDKYEAEMREVERSEKQTQEKYNTMKTDFNDIESENLRLQSLCKQKEQEVTDMLKIKNKLVEERGNVSDVIRQEFADRLVLTDEENKRMKNELSELRARQRLELERINNEKEEELAEVHKRVRQAIVKKEDAILQIREQYNAALKRADHLESLLEQQRKKLLGKKK